MSISLNFLQKLILLPFFYIFLFQIFKSVIATPSNILKWIFNRLFLFENLSSQKPLSNVGPITISLVFKISKAWYKSSKLISGISLPIKINFSLINDFKYHIFLVGLILFEEKYSINSYKKNF